MKLEIFYLLVVVSCIPCVNLKPLRPVEITTTGKVRLFRVS